MTVHGGAQLHDVIGQGRHSSASFWRPLTGDDLATIAMARPNWVPFITAASSQGACNIGRFLIQARHPLQISAGCRPGTLQVLLHASPPSVTGAFPKRRLTKPSLGLLHGLQKAPIASSRMTRCSFGLVPTAFPPCPRP